MKIQSELQIIPYDSKPYPFSDVFYLRWPGLSWISKKKKLKIQNCRGKKSRALIHARTIAVGTIPTQDQYQFIKVSFYLLNIVSYNIYYMFWSVEKSWIFSRSHYFFWYSEIIHNTPCSWCSHVAFVKLKSRIQFQKNVYVALWYARSLDPDHFSFRLLQV